MVSHGESIKCFKVSQFQIIEELKNMVAVQNMLQKNAEKNVLF